MAAQRIFYSVSPFRRFQANCCTARCSEVVLLHLRQLCSMFSAYGRRSANQCISRRPFYCRRRPYCFWHVSHKSNLLACFGVDMISPFVLTMCEQRSLGRPVDPFPLPAFVPSISVVRACVIPVFAPAISKVQGFVHVEAERRLPSTMIIPSSACCLQ